MQIDCIVHDSKKKKWVLKCWNFIRDLLVAIENYLEKGKAR